MLWSGTVVSRLIGCNIARGYGSFKDNPVRSRVSNAHSAALGARCGLARVDPRAWRRPNVREEGYGELRVRWLMPLKICVLGSGSGGNCTYVASERTAILVDAGLSARETGRRLAAIGVAAESIAAVCFTHEHSDHTAGLAVLQRRGGLELYANSGTIEGIEQRNGRGELRWNVFTTGESFLIGDLVLEPFSVPHDAYDPVGFVIRAGAARAGIVTDMGAVTGLIRERLRPCHAIVVESNHDEGLLRDAERPWHLKQRIFGRQGHLSNDHAAELVGEIASAHLDVVFLAHLSAECNRPDLALKVALAALRKRGITSVTVKVAPADAVSEMWVSAV
jgi:phosphoribosyl 1,2-cyclic phosphodiesterase